MAVVASSIGRRAEVSAGPAGVWQSDRPAPGFGERPFTVVAKASMPETRAAVTTSTFELSAVAGYGTVGLTLWLHPNFSRPRSGPLATTG
ncbi:hypothetical protein ACIQOW_35565 [Kitasatospora sp. NPDC091335]|uniref:hypothetical protein n=1 Tax=Kitasatospora sp. NPDC091335 TaxID=3364085 RepID=UPI00380A448E